MKIYTPPLNTGCLLGGGTSAKAQSNFLQINGESFKNVGEAFLFERTGELVKREKDVLAKHYGIDLKRDAERTLRELIKAGQVSGQARAAQRTFRASGRKAKVLKVEQTTTSVADPAPPSETQANIPASSSVKPVQTSPIKPAVAQGGGERPHVHTRVSDQFPHGDILRSVLMAFVLNDDIPALKSKLASIQSDWRLEEMPEDCRAALEWVDAQ